MERDGFESILPSGTSFVPETYFPELHIEVIGDDEDILERDLIEIGDRSDRFS